MRKDLSWWQTMCTEFRVILFLCCDGAEASIIICFVSGKMEAHGDHMVFLGLWFRNRAEIHQV